MSFRESDYGFDGGTINAAWQARAQCRDYHPEALWPLPKSGALVEEARRICAGCPVRVQCLRDGVDAGEWESVRGGLTGLERADCHRAGLEPWEYPEPVPAVRTKPCCRCRVPFEHNPLNPYIRLCPTCAPATPAHLRKTVPCTACASTLPDSRRRGMCDACYRTALRAVAAC